MLVKASDRTIQNFPLPQPDLFGFCDNYKSASFLEQQSHGRCTQPISELKNAASTFLNVNTYTTPFYLNGAAPSSSANAIKLGQLYSVSADGIVTKNSSKRATSFNAVTCTASNAVKEVFYRVFYTSREGFYQVSDITVDILQLDQLQLDPKYCSSVATPELPDYLFE